MFERRPDLCAVRHPAASAPAGAVAVVTEDAHTAWAVHASHATTTADETRPVYASGDGGSLAVPTGRVFVTFAKGHRADEKRRDFEALGFTIEQVPAYAPHAAWLAPREGGVAEALVGLAKLHAIAGVEHVEPQMLMERALRR